MIKEVPLSYMVIVKNVANGNITFVREVCCCRAVAQCMTFIMAIRM